MILKGYIFSRPFLGERVPQHIQNIVLQDYCKKNNIDLQLSATEYTYNDSSFILMELLEKIDKYDGIIFYSLLQLPKKIDVRFNLYKKILKKKKYLYFAVENIHLKNEKDKKIIEEIFRLKLITSEDIKKNLGSRKFYVNYRHKKVKRDYLLRMNNQKTKCMIISKKYDFHYWDGDRKYGYGGYKYIQGYHTYLAKKLIKDYKLTKNSKILDIGCGKGFLVYELQRQLNSKNIYGCEYSKYAIKNSKKELHNKLFFQDLKKKINKGHKEFDLVICINVLHNLTINQISESLKEIERVSKNKFVCVESYENEKQQFNLQCWALTAETLIDTNAWKWLFKLSGYTGDFEFIFFD